MRTQTDNQIIQLLDERDESALKMIEREYGKLCHKISLDILKNQQDAEECCNDALLRVWSSVPPMRPASLRAYLVTIVRHLSIDRYKAGKAKCRADSQLVEAIDELDNILAGNDDVERAVDQKQLIAAAEAFMLVIIPWNCGRILRIPPTEQCSAQKNWIPAILCFTLPTERVATCLIWSEKRLKIPSGCTMILLTLLF